MSERTIVTPKECAVCGSRVSNVHNTSVGIGDCYRENVGLCDLCYTTASGNMLIYSHNDDRSQEVVRCIHQVANVILERMKHGNDFEWGEYEDSEDAEEARP